MTDNQSLLLVLVLLTLWESGVWVRNDAIVFVLGWSGQFRPDHPASLAGLHRVGLTHGTLVPPLEPPLVCPAWPVSLSPEGACAYVSQALHPEGRLPQSDVLVRWEDLRKVEAGGGEVRVNGAPFAKGLPAAIARRAATRMEEIAKLPPEAREAAIRKALAESFDLDALAARLAELRKRTFWLRAACNTLFLHLFVVSPALVIRWEAPFAVLVIFPVLVFLMIVTCTLFARAHRALHPHGRGDRLRNLLPMTVYPPMAVRALDRVATGVLDGFHPLAAAALLCPQGTFERFARTVLLDLRHPIAPVWPSADPAVQAVERWWRELVLTQAEKFLRRQKLDPEALTAPPAPMDGKSRTYCPRCRDQYVLERGTCKDCGGLELVALPAGKPTDAPKA